MIEQSQASKGPTGIFPGDQEFVRIGSLGIVAKSSWLYHLVKRMPLIYPSNGQWYPIARSYRLLNQERTAHEVVEPISIDQGNGAFKLAGQTTTSHQLVSITLASRIEVVEDQVLHGSSRHPTWRVGGTKEALGVTRVRVAEGATGSRSRGFAVGKTSERFEDPSYATALIIAVVQLLKKLGHKPGEHRLVVGLALRIPEIIIDEKGKQQVDPDVVQAIKQLKGTFVVEETNGEQTHLWTITLARIFPTTQTIGSYFLWNYNLIFEPAQTTFRQVTVLDMGTGDLGATRARKAPGEPLIIEGNIVGQGAGQFANAIVTAMQMHFPRANYTVDRAQQSIIKNELEIAGQAFPLLTQQDLRSAEEEEGSEDTREMPVPVLGTRYDAAYNMQVELGIDRVRQSYRESIERFLVAGNPYLQDQSSFLICTGGALMNALLRTKLQRRMKTLERTNSDSLLMPTQDDFTVQANALGTYVYVCWQINRLIAAEQQG